MIVYPNAKINLGLTVVERRPDGYHNLETVFYPVNLQDALELKTIETDIPECGYKLKVSGSILDGSPEDNLVVKGLSVKSNYKADLCVAGGQQGLVNVVSETKDLVLCSLDPATKKLVDLIPYEVPDKDVVIEDESNLLGESVMVIPGEASYEIELVMSQSGSESKLPIT